METWHGRDGVTLADERARQQGTQTSTYTGAPVLDPTDEGTLETERWARLRHRHMAKAAGQQSSLALRPPRQRPTLQFRHSFAPNFEVLSLLQDRCDVPER